MKKKMIALFLSATVIMANVIPASAAQFSDGNTGTESQASEASELDVFDDESSQADSFEESLFVDDMPAPESAESSSVLTDSELPALDELGGEVKAAAVEGDMYTINFEGELILDQTQEFVRLLNIERAKLGVPPVQIDQQMMEKAIKRAPEVAVYYSHQMPTGEDQDQVYGVSAECIDYTHGDANDGKAQEFINDFKRSSTHWGILTDKSCTRIGAAICKVPWTKKFGGKKENGKIKASQYTYSIVVPQVGIDWGAYEPYTGSYENGTKIFSQKIRTDFFKGLSGEGLVYETLNIGDEYIIHPEAVSGKNFYEIISIEPNGYWKTMTPKTVSVDQNGKVTGISPGEGIVRYYLKNGSDEFSEFLFEVSGTSKPSVKKPSTPKLSGAVSGYTNAKLTWNKTSNTKGYQVYKYNSKTKKYQKIKTLGASSTSFTENLGYGKTAQYKVRAYNKNSAGKTVYGNFSSVKTIKTAASTPSLSKVSNASKGKLKLSWKKSSGAEGYQIYRKTGKNGSYKRIKTITSGSATSYTNSKLKKGTTCYYKIRAYRKGADKKTIYSKWSKTIGSTCR